MHAKIKKKTEIIDKSIVVAKIICTRKFTKQLVKKMYDAFIFFSYFNNLYVAAGYTQLLRFFYIFPQYKRRFSQDMTGGPKAGEVTGGDQRSGDVW